ncbi:hypothetical protein F4860DRAFT_12313 [Xylaria cubensis]|nr:hypothetical protein F4860DRAFT_12313 [Xylaria cubensis]
MLPASHIFVFHNCGRDNPVKASAQNSGIQAPLLLNPSSCRKSFSMGHLCNKFGLTEIHSSSRQYLLNVVKETRFNPSHTYLATPNHDEIHPFTNPLFPKTPQDMILASPSLSHTPYTERWRSARDIFTQYNISRPSGWLSDNEDLSLSGDGNASPRRYCRYCHICSVPTLAPTHCLSCGHRLYERCKFEVSSGTPQAHAGFSHHLSPTVARDGSQYVSTSRIDPKLMQRLSQGKEVARSTSENRNHDRTDMQLRRPFNIRADTSWRKISGRGKEMTFSEISAPTSSDHQRMNEEQRKQNGGDTSNMPPQVVVEKSDFNENPAREKSDVPHRHHSAGFHSFHHIAEHLSSAVGHNAHDLVRGRSEKETRPVSSKTSVKRSPYLLPLTKPKPVTRIDSFHWTQDTVPPGHPGRSGGDLPLTEAATKASKHQLHENAERGTAHKARNSTLESTIVLFKQKETLSDLNLPQRNAQPRTLRLVSTPPWLKNPTKEAADATAPLHHVDVKSHETDRNDHAYAPSTAVDDWSGRLALHSINSIRKADTPEERGIPPIRTHSSPSMEATYTPISVSIRRKIFESVQDHADIASSVKKANYKRKTLPCRVRHREAIPVARSGLSRSFVES